MRDFLYYVRKFFKIVRFFLMGWLMCVIEVRNVVDLNVVGSLISL